MFPLKNSPPWKKSWRRQYAHVPPHRPLPLNFKSCLKMVVSTFQAIVSHLGKNLEKKFLEPVRFTKYEPMEWQGHRLEQAQHALTYKAQGVPLKIRSAPTSTQTFQLGGSQVRAAWPLLSMARFMIKTSPLPGLVRVKPLYSQRTASQKTRIYGVEGHRLEQAQPALTYKALAVLSNFGSRSSQARAAVRPVQRLVMSRNTNSWSKSSNKPP